MKEVQNRFFTNDTRENPIGNITNYAPPIP